MTFSFSQDETVRLLHNIRADNGSQSQQQPSRQVSQGGGKDRKGGESNIKNPCCNKKTTGTLQIRQLLQLSGMKLTPR